jgi:hypothetical protein
MFAFGLLTLVSTYLVKLKKVDTLLYEVKFHLIKLCFRFFYFPVSQLANAEAAETYSKEQLYSQLDSE